MVYTLCKYPDETEVVLSDIRQKDIGEEYIRVSFERPTEHGFDTVVFELPSYKIIEREGNYSDEEVEEFKQIVERGANLFFKYAREGGLKLAQFIRNNADTKFIFGQMSSLNLFMSMFQRESHLKILLKFG